MSAESTDPSRPDPPAPASLRQRTMGGLIWSGLQSWARQLTTFLVMLVLARLLDPEDFGIVAYAYAFLFAFHTFTHLGFSDALIQHRELDRLHQDTAFWIQVVSTTLIVAGFWVAGGIMLALHWPNELPWLLRWMSIGLWMDAVVGVQIAILRRKFRFRELALPSTVGVVVGGAFGIVCAVRGYGPWALVGQQLAGAITGGLGLWLVGRWRPRLAFDWARARQLLHFGGGIMGVNLVTFFSVQFQDLVIGGVLGKVALGYYSVAARLLWVINNVLNKVTGPVLLAAMSELQRDAARLRVALGRTMTLMTALVIPLCAGLAVSAPLLVPVLFGDKWMPSVPLMQWLCLAAVAWVMGTPLDQTIVAVGKPYRLFWLKFIHAALSVALLLIFVHWGLLAVVIAFSVRSWVMIPMQLYVLRRLTGFGNRAFVAAVARPAAAGGVMAGVMWGVQWLALHWIGAVPNLILSSAAAVVTYFGLMWWIDRPTITEVLGMAKGLRKRPGQETQAS